MSSKRETYLQEIRKGVDLEIYLPLLGNQLADKYHHYALLQLAMEYVTFYETYCENNDVQEEIEKYIIQINAIVEKVIKKEYERTATEHSVVQLDEIRKSVIKKMDMLTAYTDTFQIYEYVLNRIEPRWKEELNLEPDEIAAAKIMNYIFDTKDNVIVNEKIKEILGQLPIRMTKQKYYDILCDSLNLYQGGELDSLNQFLYLFRSSAMLYRPEGMEENFPFLKEIEEKMKAADYQDITEEEYDILRKELTLATEFLCKVSDQYCTLQSFINKIYTLILTYPYIDPSNLGMENFCLDIIAEIVKKWKEKKRTLFEDSVYLWLEKVEGRQELFYEKIELLEGSMNEVYQEKQDVLNKLSLLPVYDSLQMCSRLLSSSMFAELKVDRKLREKAEEGKIREEKQELLTELTHLFSASPRYVVRAVMGNTLALLPVFLNNKQEVADYIIHALRVCGDQAEKYASESMINQIMGNVYD